MVRVGVGQEDGVDFFRAHAQLRQAGDQCAADAVDPTGARIHQHRVPATADQIGANLNGLR